MPGARPPQPTNVAAGTLKDVGRALAQANSTQLLSLEKKKGLPRTSLKASDGVSSVLFYCSLNAVISAALIGFNKYLMTEGRYPYPVPLVVLHTSASSLCVGLFFVVYRGFSRGPLDGDSGYFASLPQALMQTSLKTKICGLGGLFAAQLVFSNAAYLYSSIVFIQMMKEGNLPFVYMLSVLAAMETVHWPRVRVLICIVFATLLTIKGEVNFTWLGFMIQLVGQSFEGVRIVTQSLVLHESGGVNMDVLTYMLLVMPVCTLLLASFLVFNDTVWQVSAIATPTWEVSMKWAPLLLANALLAVALNFSTALVVKHASAVGLVLSGIMKDSAIVLVGAWFLQESITSLQVFGFGMQIVGILIYSLIKLYPDQFEDGFTVGFKRIVGMDAPCQVRHSQGDSPPFSQITHYGAAQTEA